MKRLGSAGIMVAGLAAAMSSGHAQAIIPHPTVELVSVSSAETQGYGSSKDIQAAVTANGRFVVFASDAPNLVRGDRNFVRDIFVRDRVMGTTVRASVASDGTEANARSSSYVSISALGRFVAFGSDASNLVPGDTNLFQDVFVHDLVTGETTRVSVSSDGSEGHDYSLAPTLSADGRFVAFESYAPNLVPNDTNHAADVFLHDRYTGQTTLVSVSSEGIQGNSGSGGPSLSANGKILAFSSVASNLVPNDTNTWSDVFVRDLVRETTVLVSKSSQGVQGTKESNVPSISANGRYVVFDSLSPNLVPDDRNDIDDIFVHDLGSGTTVRANIGWNGQEAKAICGEDGCLPGADYPEISADGRIVTWDSYSYNMVRGDTNGDRDAFLRDLLSQRTIRVDVSESGEEAVFGGFHPALAPDGMTVAYESFSNNLVEGDTNGFNDIFAVAWG